MNLKKCILLFIVMLIVAVKINAQLPNPANLGFEYNNFQNWKKYMNTSGATIPSSVTYNTTPLTGTNTTYAALFTSTYLVAGTGSSVGYMRPTSANQKADKYGNYPVVCNLPGAGIHSCRLGCDSFYSIASGVRYNIKIPVNKNNYRIVFYYAVDFEDPGAHETWEMPFFRVSAFDSVNNANSAGTVPMVLSKYDTAFLGNLHKSNIMAYGNGDTVYYASWMPATMIVKNMGGKTLSLDCMSAGCSPAFGVGNGSPGSHFSYSYIDFDTANLNKYNNSNLQYCFSDTAFNYTPPPGYKGYIVYDSATGNILGVDTIHAVSSVNTITMKGSNIPKPKSVMKVALIPYSWYGIADTLTYYVDTVSCLLPTITSFSPAIASTGNTITITGANLTGTVSVSLGGITVSSFNVVNTDTITAIVGSGASGNVSVTTLGGTVSLAGFNYCKPTITKNINYTGCNTVLYNGINYTASTILKDTIRSVYGCDSVYNITNITVNKSGTVSIDSINLSSCNTVMYKNINYYSSTTFKDTVLNAHGCDSIYRTVIITLNKIIPITNTINLSGCNSIVYNGITYSNSAIERDTVKSLKGCDSIYNVVVIYVSKISPSVANVNLSGCSFVSYKNNIYTSNTVFLDTVRSMWGCDSIYNVVQITILGTSAVSDTLMLSNCDSVIYKGIQYYTSINFVDTLKTIAGCDSIYTIVYIKVNNAGISGNIVYPNLKPIPNLTINLTGATSQSVYSNGHYTFGCPSLGNNNTIRISRTFDVSKANGVSALDIALTQSHILQKSIFNSPYKVIAADVTGDGKVSALDIVYMKRLVLGIDTTFTNSSTTQKRLWVFIDSAYKFTDSSNPFPFKDSISFNGLNTNMTNQTFIGCKLGDVNWDWNPAVARPQVNNVNAVELSYNSIKVNNSGQIIIPVKIKNFKEMLGMQFTISFDADKFQWQGMGNNPLGIETGTNHSAEGSISFLWVDPKNEIKTMEDGSVIMELVFRKIDNGQLIIDNGNPLNLNGDITAIAAYDKDYNLHNIVLNSSTINISEMSKDTWTVAPNPANDGIIHVQMNLHENKNIVFRLSDNTGRVLFVKQIVGSKGSNNIILRDGNIPYGTYYLHAVGMEGEDVRKIIIVN